MSVNDTDPALLFGGTWERIQGRFLLAADDTYKASSTGGEAEHRLTVAEMPSHTHSQYWFWTQANAGNGSSRHTGTSEGYYQTTGSAGSNQPHNNMPPYLAVYMWQRVA